MFNKNQKAILVACTALRSVKDKLIDRFNKAWVQIYDTNSLREAKEICALHEFYDSDVLIILDEDQYDEKIKQEDSKFYLVITEDELCLTDVTGRVCKLPKTMARTDYLVEFLYMMQARQTEARHNDEKRQAAEVALATLEEIKRI